MLSVLERGIDASAPLANSITTLSAINYLHIASNDASATTEKIKQLLGSPSSRIHALLLIKTGLEQNAEVYGKGKWGVEVTAALQDSGPSILKEYACETFCVLIPYIAKETSVYGTQEHNTMFHNLFPFLLDQIDENVEWCKSALKCVYMWIKHFPQTLLPYKGRLFSVILRKVSHCVTSELIEIVADCFAASPSICKFPKNYQDEWKKLYLGTIKTLQLMMRDATSVIRQGVPFRLEPIDVGGLVFDEDSDLDQLHLELQQLDQQHHLDHSELQRQREKVTERIEQHSYIKEVRKYVNLCKCLAKLLSAKTTIAEQYPAKSIICLFIQLFQVQEFYNAKSTNLVSQLFFCYVSQMQVASLILLEPVILNLNVVPHSSLISELISSALTISNLKHASTETISQIRLIVWKLVNIFVKKYAAVSPDLVSPDASIIDELLNDIHIDENNIKATGRLTFSKSKKSASHTVKKKLVNRKHQKVCEAALQTLEQLIYAGSAFFPNDYYKDVFTKVLKIAHILSIASESFPFPYDYESCRVNLYSTILALILNSKWDQSEIEQCAIGLLRNASQDSSYEVTGICNKAMSILSIKIHPKRFPFKYTKSVPIHKNESKVPYPLVMEHWSSEKFTKDIPDESMSNPDESVTARSAQSFHGSNQSAMMKGEPMDEDLEDEHLYTEHYEVQGYAPNYSPNQRGAEKHRDAGNKEMQHSSQSHDEFESLDPDDDDDDVGEAVGDEEEVEEEEEDEDEEELNYLEDEIQIDTAQKNMNNPSTSRLHVMSPRHGNQETSIDQECEQQQQNSCDRTEVEVESIKNVHVNGENSIVPDADVPSSSTQPSTANENGISDFEEEIEGENDEPVVRTPSSPIEKRAFESFPDNTPPPAAKKQKIDHVEPKSATVKDERSRSPTLEEMKADFYLGNVGEDGDS